MTDLKQRIVEALTEALGEDAHDCLRVWSAWSHGTMGPDDFYPIIHDSDRMEELAEAVMNVLKIDQNDLIEKAADYVYRYEDDPREGIKSDCMNAYMSGAYYLLKEKKYD